MKLLYTLIILFAFSFAEVISVTGFRNNTSNSEFDWLGEALADNISSDLSKIKSLTIVNRRELKKVIDEQKFSYTSGLVDIETSVELGKMLGATKLVTGDFTVINRTLRLNLNYIDIETGVTEKSLSKSGELDKILYFQNALVLELLEKLNIKTDEIEKMEISNFETNNIEAVENNYKGVIAFDRKKLDEAIEYFEKAIEIDPYYRMANEKLKESNELFINGIQIDKTLKNMLEISNFQNNSLYKLLQHYKDLDYGNLKLNNYKVGQANLTNNTVELEIELQLDLNEEYFKELFNTFNSLLLESNEIHSSLPVQNLKDSGGESFIPLSLMSRYDLSYDKDLYVIRNDFFENHLRPIIRYQTFQALYNKEFSLVFKSKGIIIDEMKLRLDFHRVAERFKLYRLPTKYGNNIYGHNVSRSGRVFDEVWSTLEIKIDYLIDAIDSLETIQIVPVTK